MSDKITESAIEKFAVELLEKAGYQYIYGEKGIVLIVRPGKVV